MSFNSRSSKKKIQIFFDTEYTDFRNLELISIGLIADTGENFYAENLEFNDLLSSAWVKKNVYPSLDNKKHGLYLADLKTELIKWLSNFSDYEIIFVSDYYKDEIIFKKYFGEISEGGDNHENMYDILANLLASKNEIDLDEAENIIRLNYGHMISKTYTISKRKRNHSLHDVVIMRHTFNKLAQKIKEGKIENEFSEEWFF